MSANAQPFGDAERSRPRLRAIPALPRPGDTIAGKYALVRLIGEGGMGVVYEANHVRLQQRLAIKVLRPDVPDFGGVVTRFEREARAAAQLQSIHAARVIDVDALPNGLPYIVLEFLEGRDLDAELEQTGPMSVEDAVDVVLQVTDAMSEAHALGIVHRDLKPSNLFVCRVGEQARRVIKVLDFGISKSESDDTRLTPSHAYFGTPYYAAPEQLRAATTADARSDVWSLGAILFELLTGRTPFVGTPTSVITQVISDPVPWPLTL
ncbi:MAG TPA: serine/threonine-protein kinase, partial [Polyangiaceae bacterium]|nr:serine/threonine-protein kinase [Polyangiaceae bacterium]